MTGFRLTLSFLLEPISFLSPTLILTEGCGMKLLGGRPSAGSSAVDFPTLDRELLLVLRMFSPRNDNLLAMVEPVEVLSCLAARGVSGAGRGSKNLASPA